MKYAPIIIPTMCRYEHFVRLIESLLRNRESRESDLYVGIDFPPKEKYVDGYRRICEFADEIVGFKSVNIIKHRENLGSRQNYCNLVKEVLRNHDSFIRMDDDVEVSPNFLSYMNACLEHYSVDDSVLAISGYKYSFDWSPADGTTVFRESLLCPMWGTAFWRDKYLKMDEYITSGKLKDNATEIARSGKLKRALKSALCEFSDLCLCDDHPDSLVTWSTDIAIRLYLIAEGYQVIMPVISKTRNWGFDGTGEYCGYDDRYANQEIDLEEEFNHIVDDGHCRNKPSCQMQRKEGISVKRSAIARLKIILFLLLGKKQYSALINKMRKFKNI